MTTSEETGVIETVGLFHRYDLGESRSVTALAGVDVKIPQGEFLAIIGPNASGKSTLAKHFNALLLPSKGTVRVFGLDTRDPENTWEIRRNAGMVFQNPDNQLVATVVEEDVAFGLENLGVDSSHMRLSVKQALEAVDMWEFARHEPHLLSGGQKQRVAIAGILAMKPKCIVLDEPTAMLDPKGRAEVMDTVRKLNKESGVTIIYITHYMDEALLADRVLVMNQGKIFMEGSPVDVFMQKGKLVEVGLDLPPLGKLLDNLISYGLDIKKDAFTIDGLVNELCRLKLKN